MAKEETGPNYRSVKFAARWHQIFRAIRHPPCNHLGVRLGSMCGARTAFDLVFKPRQQRPITTPMLIRLAVPVALTRAPMARPSVEGDRPLQATISSEALTAPIFSEPATRSRSSQLRLIRGMLIRWRATPSAPRNWPSGHSPEPVIPEIGQPGAELVAQEPEQAEDQVAVAGRVLMIS